MSMVIGVMEVGVVIVAIAVLLWLLPKSLPQLGRAFREFKEEVKGK